MSDADHTAIRIRPAGPEDTSRITDLAGQLGYPSSEDEIRRRMAGFQDDPYHAVFLADDGQDGVVGWVEVELIYSLIFDPQIEVLGLVVDSGHRGNGIGEQLMAFAEQWGRNHGCGRLRLRSNEIRKRAHRFYQRLEYVIVKTSYQFEKKL